MGPLRRIPDLIPLSREHHDGLLLCWKIRMGLKKNVEPERIVAYLNHFYETHLKDHFRIEEEIVLPVLDAKNAYRMEADAHHKALEELINDLKKPNPASADELEDFASLLESHIRFEERVLFGIIETEASPSEMLNIRKQLSARSSAKTEWADPFWLYSK